MVSVPKGLILGASGLVSRQLERGDRGSVPASAARLNARQRTRRTLGEQKQGKNLRVFYSCVCLSVATKNG